MPCALRLQGRIYLKRSHSTSPFGSSASEEGSDGEIGICNDNGEVNEWLMRDHGWQMVD